MAGCALASAASAFGSGRSALVSAIALIGSPFALASAVGAREDTTPQEPPFRSEGEIDYFLDLAAFRGADGRTEQQIYLAVANDQLAFRAKDADRAKDAAAPLESRLHLEASFRDEKGDEVFRAESDLSPSAAERLDAEDHAIVQSIRERAVLAPGTYRLEVLLVDRLSEKPGLLDRIRNVRNKGRVERWVRVPTIPPGPSSSDLVFVRSARAAALGDPWARSGVDFDANPSRYYGVVLPAVRTFVEVYADEGWQAGDTYLVQTQLLDLAGLPLRERTSRATPRETVFGLTDELPLDERLTAGTYRLAVTLLNERTREASRAERRFEVIWALDSWGREPDEILQEMILVMTDAEYRVLEKLAPGAREVYLAEFWRGLDPDPATPENRRLDEFRSRIAYADANFGTPMRRGILTDRGRVLVRYGAPDDEVYQFSASNFGSIEGAIEEVSEPGERATMSSRPSTSFLNPDEFREGDVQDLAEQRGGATVKSQQLVVWKYDGRGSPLRPDRQEFSGASHRGLRFVFADAMGNGDYQLIGSSGTSIR